VPHPLLPPTLALVVASVLGGAVGTASAHIHLRYPTARTEEQKRGPCGAVASAPGGIRGASATTLAPGSTITVAWDETIEHPGHFRISFDADGQDFSNPVTGAEVFAETLLDDIVDRVVTGPGNYAYAAEVTLPEIECERCTLQIIQVMSETPPFAAGDLYFQCADLVLANDAPPPDAGGPIGGGDPAPGDGGDGGGGGGDGAGAGDDAVGGNGAISGGCAASGGEGDGATGALAIVLALLVAAARRQRSEIVPPSRR
jgi:MYXO-CTERM domain-containing protein